MTRGTTRGTMRAVIISRTTALSGFLLAIAEGLRRHRIEVELTLRDHGDRADFYVCWGWKKAVPLRARGQQVLVVERGYIGDRFAWTSLAWNGLNGRGDFCLGDDDDAHIAPGRFEKLHGSLLRPWRRDGHYTLILGQVPGDQSLEGRNLLPWYRDTATIAARRFGQPILFRPHPVAVQRGLYRTTGLDEIDGTLEAALSRAAVAITWNSNAAVDAVLAGCPAIAMDPGSMAWAVTAHKIDARLYPDRAAWANRLAWCQWSLEELKAGAFWPRMQRGLYP